MNCMRCGVLLCTAEERVTVGELKSIPVTPTDPFIRHDILIKLCMRCGDHMEERDFRKFLLMALDTIRDALEGK